MTIFRGNWRAGRKLVLCAQKLAEKVMKAAHSKHLMHVNSVTVRFFLILVSLFYVEVSVTRPVFHIWYCTRGFLFRLKIVLPPS